MAAKNHQKNNSRWNQNYSAYDLNGDSYINSLDYAILSSNWLKTW